MDGSQANEESKTETDSDDSAIPEVLGESFDKFPQITETSIQNLKRDQITGLFPIQANTFEHIYAGKDVIARDLTGTGKTLAFCLPLVERFRKEGLLGGKRKTLSIMLTPTRELAVQISAELEKLQHFRNEFKVATIYGGVSIERQENLLRSGVEFIVGTTGRVQDHIQRGNTNFSEVKSVVLDEADRMLDMGFQQDVETIMEEVTKQCTDKPQFILFSATIPPWVRNVAKKHLSSDNLIIDLVKDLKNKTAKTVEHLSIPCDESRKVDALADILAFHATSKSKVIVFTQTKLQASKIISSPLIASKSGGEQVFE
jgi:ATP-dependent RNA helicase DDX21